MDKPSTDLGAKNAFHKFQRLAVSAAAAGLLASAILVVLKLSMDRLAPGNAQLQTSFEAACIFLWPSAILLLGAQTAHGGVVLFLLSACLNAGYFVFAVMLIAAAFDKVRSRARIPATVSVTRQSANSQLVTHVPSSRSAA